MLGNYMQQKFVPRDYDIFAGLDVDKKNYDVSFINHGQQMKSMKIPAKSNHLINYVRRHFQVKKIAFVYEAGPTGYGLYDQLTSAGYPCLVVAPAMVPMAPGKRVKTNRLDSKKLSIALKGGELESIYVPSSTIRDLRHLTQLRDVFVKQTIASKVRIKALLLHEGLIFPGIVTWSRQVLFNLQSLSCRSAVRFKLDRLIESLIWHQNQVLATTREIRRFCRQNASLAKHIQLLMTIPGIGWIVASQCLARLGPEGFLTNVRQISGFIGVVPSESSTGDTINKGSITRTGDGRFRSKLIQAAWSSIRKDPELYDFYSRIYQRNPKPMAARKAIVAVANKLCKRIACVLKQQRPYVVRPLASSKKEETAMLQGTTRLSSEPSAPCAA